jgi:hypothetical protein
MNAHPINSFSGSNRILNKPSKEKYSSSVLNIFLNYDVIITHYTFKNNKIIILSCIKHEQEIIINFKLS